MTIRFRILGLFALLMLVSSTNTFAQGLLKPDDDQSPENIERARIFGILVYTRITVSWEEKPAREAFKELAAALNIPIAGRYDDDARGHGLDAAMPITVDASQQCALDLLEEMLEQCEVYEDCTWQIRNAKLEVGTKRRLATFSTRENRRYDLTDLLLEPPYFLSSFAKSRGGGRFAAVDSPYVDAVLGSANREMLRGGDAPIRKHPMMIAEEIIEGIVETIEPGHWDYGYEEEDEEGEAVPVDPDAPVSTNPGTKNSIKAASDPRKWASLRYFRKSLVINAPDFMHRQVGGYPTPIVPELTEVDIRKSDTPQKPVRSGSPKIAPVGPARR